MKIKNLRQWLENLPTDYDENGIVFRAITIKYNDETLEGYE